MIVQNVPVSGRPSDPCYVLIDRRVSEHRCSPSPVERTTPTMIKTIFRPVGPLIDNRVSASKQ